MPVCPTCKQELTEHRSVYGEVFWICENEDCKEGVWSKSELLTGKKKVKKKYRIGRKK